MMFRRIAIALAIVVLVLVGVSARPPHPNNVKSYVARISHSGTGNPNITVVYNDLGGTVVWTRQEEGLFRGSLPGAFPVGKTVFSPSRTVLNWDYQIALEESNGDSVELYAADNFPTFDFEIRVYP